jgi:hypothetical protein
LTVTNNNYKPSTYPTFILNSITKHKYRGFKLINSTSFGESVFSTGFIQKTVKGDLFVKGNCEIPPHKQRGKILEDSRRLSTEADLEGLPCGAGQPHRQAG